MSMFQQMTKWRFALVVAGLSALPAALVWHLAHLQVIPGETRDFRFLQNAGEARTLRSEKLNAYRGVITDRHGEILAVSTPVTTLFANPQELDRAQLPALAKALGIAAQDLRARVAKYQNKQFMYLERHLPPPRAEAVMHKRFAGVYAQEEFQRFYPAGEVAAHIVGFTGIDEHGQEGIELGFNTWLAGEQGEKRLIKDLRGNVVKDLGLVKSPRSGNDLRLTIDLRLQYLAHKVLKNAIAEQGAASGSMVMLQASTGEILAVVNQPSYNPNNRADIRPQQLRNRAFTDVFEPGSTMKPFTVLAALEQGIVSPSYTVDTSPGYIFIGGKVIPDPVNYGVLTLGKIIAKSSQVGISKLAMAMDPNDIRDMYFRAGLGQSSGIGFPGESVGSLPNRIKWHPVEQATFAYGYGLSVNAIQLAQAYAVIASGGMFTPARLILQQEAPPAARVVDEKYVRQVRAMLEQVIQPGGTGTRAHLESYAVAGKTGTAHKVQSSGYADDKYIALFAGYAPADKPEIVTVVIIDEPPSEGEYSGGKSAAPVFASAVEKALKILRVPPQANAQKGLLALSKNSREASL